MNFRTFSEVLFNFRMTPAADPGGPRLRARHGHPRRLLPGVPRGAPEDHDGAAGDLMRRGRAGWLLAAALPRLPGRPAGRRADPGGRRFLRRRSAESRARRRAPGAAAVARRRRVGRGVQRRRGAPPAASGRSAPDPGFQSFRFQAVALGSSCLGLVCRKSSARRRRPRASSASRSPSRSAFAARAAAGGARRRLRHLPDPGRHHRGQAAVESPTGYSWSVAANAPSVLQPGGRSALRSAADAQARSLGLSDFEFRVVGRRARPRSSSCTAGRSRRTRPRPRTWERLRRRGRERQPGSELGAVRSGTTCTRRLPLARRRGSPGHVGIVLEDAQPAFCRGPVEEALLVRDELDRVEVVGHDPRDRDVGRGRQGVGEVERGPSSDRRAPPAFPVLWPAGE